MNYSFGIFKRNILRYIDEIIDVVINAHPSDDDYATAESIRKIDCAEIKPDGTWMGNYWAVHIIMDKDTDWGARMIEKGIHDRRELFADMGDEMPEYMRRLMETDVYPTEHDYNTVIELLIDEFDGFVNEIDDISWIISDMCIDLEHIIKGDTDSDNVDNIDDTENDTDGDTVDTVNDTENDTVNEHECDTTALIDGLNELINYIRHNTTPYCTLHQTILELNKIHSGGSNKLCDSNEYIYAYKRYDNGGYYAIDMDLKSIASDIDNEISRYRKWKRDMHKDA